MLRGRPRTEEVPLLDPRSLSLDVLFAPDAAVHVDDLHLDEGGVIRIALRSARRVAACPACGQDASRIHSTYTRSLADLAWRGFPVRLTVRVRRFRCPRASCPRILFAERFGELAPPHARRTGRLTGVLCRVGLALGGEAGARLLPHLGASASPDTVLRVVRRAPAPARSTPRVLGVDDWARRRGYSYGTLLVDLEARVPVDLLPDREAASFAAWLRAHPGVEVIARDRAEVYAEGARQGAPGAAQVADRWHLHKNVGDLLERLLHAHRATAASSPADPLLPLATSPPPAPTAPVQEEAATTRPDSAPLPHAPTPAAGRQAARQALYEQIHALNALGLPKRTISARVGACPETVRKYLSASTCPTRSPRRTKVGTLTRVEGHLRARWQEGCEDAQVLWREVQALGFRGSLRTIQRHVERWRGSGRRAAIRGTTAAPLPRPPSPRQARWWLLLPPARLSEEQQRYVARLTEACEPIRAAQHLAVGFGHVLRGGDASALAPWLEEASRSDLASFRDFAAGLRRDQASIEAAVREPWSNGQTEGHVNRLKLLKRQMYGRASVPLLRQRLLATT